MVYLDAGSWLFYYTTRPVAPLLCEYPVVTPNNITIFNTVVLVPLMLHNIWTYRPIWEFAVIAYIISWLDCLDGDVARACGNGTELGPLWDSLADCFAGTTGFICIISVSQQPRWFFFPVLAYLLFVGYIGVSCQHHAERNFACSMYLPNADPLRVAVEIIVKTWSYYYRAETKSCCLPADISRDMMKLKEQQNDCELGIVDERGLVSDDAQDAAEVTENLLAKMGP